MADIRLPETLQVAIEAEVAGQPLGQAANLSAAYRAHQSSQTAIADQSDIAAYLATRLPATYAAVATVLAETGRRLPAFSPTSMLDAGAGPGTASWAATAAFPTLEAITLVDHNRKLLNMGARMRRNAVEPLASAAVHLGEFPSIRLAGRQFDLVVVSYALTELPDGQLLKAAATLWESCLGALVIVDPGRPCDYQRLMAVRAALIEAGGSVVAPCPHGLTCPLPDADWCHFSVRLPRRRLHRQAKGASLGYEDEKFSYLVVVRPGLERWPVDARVIKPPVLNKFEIALPLCTPNGLEEKRVARRQPDAFKAVRKLEWGDAIE